MKAIKLTKEHIKIEVIDLNEDKYEYNYQAMQKEINSRCIDIIHAVNLPEPYCMVVDDEALLVAEPKVNLIASYLYGTAEHGQPICGDVLIMKDHITDEGIDTVGLEEDDINTICKILSEAKFKYVDVILKLREMLGN